MGQLLRNVGKMSRWILSRTIGQALALALVLVLLSATLASSFWASQNVTPVVSSIVRDALVSVYAHIMAGPDRAIDMEYFTTAVYPVWDTGTNAPDLAKEAYEIVPFFASEGLVASGFYPRVIIFVPLLDQRSFVVWGNTDCGGTVRVNERFQDDRAGLLTTLVHELVHNQGGYFCDTPENFIGDRSTWVESHTTAGTLEVIAAMCRYGDEVACSSFWQEIEIGAARSLRSRALDANVDWLYQVFANVFLRNSRDRSKAEHMVRFWHSRPGELRDIMNKYGRLPWETMILPGICGEVLNTGNTRPIGTFEGRASVVLGMPFDDSRAMLGRGLATLLCTGV